MSLFEDASLIITPNAYKAGKLYSLKPTDGAGDLDVVRATSATRVNEQGLIEIPRTNLLLRSEEFNDAYWTKTRTTIIQNSVIAPNGTLTADKLIDDTTASASHQISRIVAVASGAYTMSIFAKKGEYNFIRFWEDVQTGKQAFFNLDTGVATNVNMDSVSIIDFGNGWYRCIAKINIPSAGNFGFRINLTSNGTTTTYNGTGTNGVFLWGAQLEVGDVATEYIPTTSVIRTRFAGITQDGGSASNIPRLDYTNASCPSILVEPQRTNLLLRSEEFDNAYWNKLASSITANSITSPDGNTTADKLIEDTSGSSHRFISTSFLMSSGTSYSASIFLKRGEREYAYIRLNNSGGDIIAANINLLNGTVSQSIFGNITIIPYNNDWYRVIATGTPISTSSGSFEVRTSNSATYANYTGNGTSGIFVWGAQLEVASNATSYIPTVASTVTRNADVISKTGISDLIGQTEGTMYVEIKAISDDNVEKHITISDGTNVNRIDLFYGFYGAGKVYYEVRAANSVQGGLLSGNLSVESMNKIAFVYKTNRFELWINGTKVAQDLIGNTFSGSTLSTLQTSLPNGTMRYFGSINLIALFKTALTDTQLSQLTTP